MKKFVSCGFMVLIVALNLWAVDGIAVTVRNQAQSYSGDHFNGDIYRIDIKGSQKANETKLVTGNSSHAHISPNGKRIAFFQSNTVNGISQWYVCVMSIDGGTITKLCPAHPYSTLDFPTNDWIYWANGCGGDVAPRMNPGSTDSAEYIFRVNANGGAREFVIIMLNPPYTQGGTPTHVGLGGEDLDVDTGLTRFCNHPYYGGASGGYTIYSLSWGDGIWRPKYTADGCGGGMSFDGHYLYLGNQDHASYRIINIDYPGGFTNTNYPCCISQIPEAVDTTVYCGNTHYPTYYGNGGATNNADWIVRCRNSVPELNGGEGQDLFNWRTGEQIVTGLGDGGDFWVGSASNATTMVLNPATLNFVAEKGGASPAAQTVQIGNSGSGTLNTVTNSISYTSGSGWLTVSAGGTGNAQTLSNAITVGSLNIGTYAATVTVSCGNAQPASALYTVALQVIDPSLTLANVTVTPAKCTTSTWSTVPFTAVATTGTGVNLGQLPAFKWAVSGGQSIDSTSGLFSAGSAPGGPYTVTASATYKGVTKSSTATVLLYRPVTITAPLQGATYKIGDT
ncbi:MAG: hypothetical protein PHC61_17405, partial [Chitinivibrionales bacterium]|nr:hypothetical protein [Chitinivibrionales bacterium]